MTLALALAGLGPAAAGTLGGTVRDAGGRPVEGAVVTALDPELAEVETVTGPDGAFSIAELRPGVYRVRAESPAGGEDAEAWAPSVADRCEAEQFVVGPDAVRDADVTLLPGGSVVGDLRLPDGSPAAGAGIIALPIFGAVSRSASAAADGSFSISGLPGGEALITFDAPGLPLQYLGGEYDDLRSPLALVVPGAPLDLGAVVLRPGIEVAGTVVGPDGPASSGTVSVYSPSQVVTVDLAPDGTWAASGLPAGEILAWAEVDGLATTYWPDADRPEARLAVADGERFVGLELDLPREAVITGTLVGGPWAGAQGVLYNSDRTIGLGTGVEDDGRFTFAGLHGGAYTLWLDGTPGGRVRGMLLDEDGAERVLVVSGGGVTDLGALDLPVAGRLTGRVTDAASGEPIGGAYVVAQPSAIEGTLSAVTDRDGRYRIEGLAAGSWELWAGHQPLCDVDPGWVSTWHPETPNPLFTVPLTLATGEERTWDVRMPPDDDHDGMDDVWEETHGLDPDADDGARDPDDDGFDNLEEYLLGTDPKERAERGCGCASGTLHPAPLALVALLVRARGSGARGRRSTRSGSPRGAS